jgi:hypothetical protein
VIEFPFLGLRITDLATLNATIGPILAVLDNLTYFDFVFEPLAAESRLTPPRSTREC